MNNNNKKGGEAFDILGLNIPKKDTVGICSNNGKESSKLRKWALGYYNINSAPYFGSILIELEDCRNRTNKSATEFNSKRTKLELQCLIYLCHHSHPPLLLGELIRAINSYMGINPSMKDLLTVLCAKST